MVVYNQRQELSPPSSDQTREVTPMLRQYRPLLFVVGTVVTIVLILGMRPLYQATHAQEQADQPPMIRWEPLRQTGAPQGSKTYRAAVPGGWLVCVYGEEKESEPFSKGGLGIGLGAGVTFVPDPQHEWK
jgi:hypothetical protein